MANQGTLTFEDDGIDAFTAWLLKWQHFILPIMALAVVASFIPR